MCGTKIIYNSVSNIINSEFFEIIKKEDTHEITFMVLTLTDDEKKQIEAIRSGSFFFELTNTITNKDIVLFAINKNVIYFNNISNEMKKDKDVVLAAVRKNENLFNENFSLEMKNDIDVVLVAVNHSGVALKHASDEMKDNDIVVIDAVKNNGYALQYASERLRKDKIVVQAAVNNNIDSLKYALVNDEEKQAILAEVVKETSYIRHYDE